MKLFANRKIRQLFCSIFSSIFIFTLIPALLAAFKIGNAALLIAICSACMSLAIWIFCRRYFTDQHKTMETAVARIGEYLSGNSNAIIECSDEGELYRLFHEVNSLVSILNAHAEREKSAKIFLKNALSDISHQLKTPLSALTVYIGIIQSEAEEDSAIREFSLLSEQELDRINTLVQNLLHIAKLDAGTVVLKKSPERVAALAESVKGHFLFRAGQEGKEIILSGSEEITLLCDRSWMLEAVSNLVKNALDHTERGGRIRIEWQMSASVVQISVKDNGSGICPEDLPHIFKRFYRSRLSRDTQGIGLGLPLAKAIVDIHNGTLEVDSVPGIGSSFIMNFLIPTKL